MWSVSQAQGVGGAADISSSTRRVFYISLNCFDEAALPAMGQ